LCLRDRRDQCRPSQHCDCEDMVEMKCMVIHDIQECEYLHLDFQSESLARRHSRVLR
jgi:hypothetical protein